MNKTVKIAGMLELAGGCLKNGVGKQDVETYEAVCKDLNVSKKDMTLILINWSQICLFSISLDTLAIYQNFFFS